MIYLKLLFVAIFWGGTFIAGRILGVRVEPFTSAFLRFFVATVCLMIALWRAEGRLPKLSWQLLAYYMGMGLSGVLAYNAFFFKGLQTVEAGRAALIIANNPIAIALLSALIFKERLTLRKVFGILLSVCGAIVAISRGSWALFSSGAIGLGEGLIALCVVSWATFSLLGKPVLQQVSPLAAVTAASAVGTLFLLPPALREGVWHQVTVLDAREWISVLYLGWFGTFLGFVWYYQGIERVGPTQAGLFINFVPISAIILAWVLLGEPLTFSLLVGAAMVVTGVLMTRTKGRPRNSIVKRKRSLDDKTQPV